MKKIQTKKEPKGLAAINQIIELDKKNALQLFKLATEERGTTEKIRSLVTHGSILQLIYMSIDMTTSTRAVVNQLKSRQVPKAAKAKQEEILDEWLDMNIHKYKGQLNFCAEVAGKSLEKKLARAPSWIRKRISVYLKEKKQP